MDDFVPDVTRHIRLKARCTCYCGGQGALIVMRCPVCGGAAFVCDEVGSVMVATEQGFENKSSLAGHCWQTTETTCPHCSADVELQYASPSTCAAFGLTDDALEMHASRVNLAAALELITRAMQNKTDGDFSGEDVAKIMAELQKRKDS